MDNKSSSKVANVSNKKWSLGGLFRRKKKGEVSESSSEEDRKAGFTPQKRKSKAKAKGPNNKLVNSFDHIIIAPAEIKHKETDSLKSFDRIITTAESNRSTGSLERRFRRERLRAARIYARDMSSDEEIVSINSSSISRFRSDESLENNSASSVKKSRAARTERYLKRMSKGDELGQIVHQVSRWHTQPISPGFTYDHSNSNNRCIRHHSSEGLRTSASLTNVPSQKLNQVWRAPTRSIQHEVIKNPDNRSISYENHLYRPSSQRTIYKSGPPAPPPRDPQRRLNIYNSLETRPLSYSFDKNTLNSQSVGISLNSRCVSDDRLWGCATSGMHQKKQPQRPASVQPAEEQRRFITRNETELAKNLRNLPTQQDYKYIADATPRSRRPIHVAQDETKEMQVTGHLLPQVNLTKSEMQSTMQSAADFWKQIDKAEFSSRGRSNERMYSVKPRSLSHSRAHDLFSAATRNNNNPAVVDLNRREANVNMDVMAKASNNSVIQPKTIMKAFENQGKTNSMPNYYTTKAILNAPSNKYEEHVAKTVTQPMQPLKYKPKLPLPMPPNRVLTQKNSTSEDDLLKSFQTKRKKSTNLEDAINELEAIYKSLGLGDENLMDRAERRDTAKCRSILNDRPNNEDDVEECDGNAEPDVVLDDVAYRHLKRASSTPKTIEPQPPFGIPLGPIPSSPSVSNYLHVSPDGTTKAMFTAHNTPDLISDDLAVRNLRKDSPVSHVGLVKVEHCIQPSALRKKQRAVRSMSENIYNLIQRDAAKPSGGCLDDYDVLNGSSINAGSLRNITFVEDDSVLPSPLQLLQRKRQKLDADTDQTKGSNIGGVFNLPSTLKTSPMKVPFIMNQHRPIITLNQKPPIPMPRNILSSDLATAGDKSGMEDILNAIAKEAQESSEKLSRELFELRKERDIVGKKEFFETSPKIKIMSNVKMEKDIDNVSRTAKRFEELLEDVVDAGVTSESAKPKMNNPSVACKQTFANEKQILRNINDVADAAKVCEQAIGFFVDSNENIHKTATQKPFLESESEKIEHNNTVAQLLEKLEPDDRQIGAIAERCMRQLTELGNLDVEILGKSGLPLVTSSSDRADYDNLNSDVMETSNRLDTNVSTQPQLKQQTEQNEHDFKKRVQEEIDKIMQECAEEAEKKRELLSKSKYVSSEEELNILLLPPTVIKLNQIYPDDNNGGTPYLLPLEDKNNKSSPDCLKSSSVTPNRINSSSITSFNDQSSSDFAKSISSDNAYEASEGMKTTSTTSCDPPRSPSAIKSSTVSPFTASSPSPLILTPADDNNRSQYNSSEELAMIFGMKTPSPAPSPGNSYDGVNISLLSTKTLPAHDFANECALPLLDSKDALINLETIDESHKECVEDELCNREFNHTNNNISMLGTNKYDEIAYLNRQSDTELDSTSQKFSGCRRPKRNESTAEPPTKVIACRSANSQTQWSYPSFNSNVSSSDLSKSGFSVLNPNNLLVALAMGVANNDLFTIAAIIVAIVTVIVLIFL